MRLNRVGVLLTASAVLAAGTASGVASNAASNAASGVVGNAASGVASNAASGGVTAAATSAAPGLPQTVTLITGDEVIVFGKNRLSVRKGPGRAGITFTTTTDGGRMRVLPSDAEALVAQGRLDAKLFEVSTLVEYGYHERDGLPLVITGGGGVRARARAMNGLKVTRDLSAVGAVAAVQSRQAAAESWHAMRENLSSGDHAPKVWLDRLLRPMLDVSVPQIGAPAAWDAGLTGAGVKVAVLDTGIDATHPDLAGKVFAQQNFTEGAEDDRDHGGHGTHVASTVAGSGATAEGGGYRGVAPGAQLLDGKVCISGGCAWSWILAGMHWAAAEQRAKVVNLSLGHPDEPGLDPLEEAVQTLSQEYGTLFVVAAGNTDGGIAYGAMSSPATADSALAVGAVDAADAMADFSRRGPRVDGALKPDISAPGVAITAALSKDSQWLPEPGGKYTTASGTSMATPHVAGSAAILAQQHPDWTFQQLKAALMASARPNPAFDVFGQGAGRVDLARAIGQRVATSPASVSFDRQLWPHSDDPVQTRHVTYHNSGGSAVTLNLGVTATGPGGSPVPTEMFILSSSTVTVPAGGQATVTVTADTRIGPDGYIGGWVTATSGDSVVRTPLAVDKEVESYDVTVTHLDRGGAAPSNCHTRLTLKDRWELPHDIGCGAGQSVTTVRVRKGRYAVVSRISKPAPKPALAEGYTVLLAQLDLDVSQQLSVTMDARLGRPVSVTPPNPSAAQVAGSISAQVLPSGTGPGSLGTGILVDSFANIYAAQIGPNRRDDSFLTVVGGQWAQPKGDGTFDDSPYVYAFMLPEWGRMITGYDRHVTPAELATVRSDFAAANPGTLGTKRIHPGFSRSGFEAAGWPAALRFRLPFTRTEYYNTDPGADWWQQFEESAGDETLSGTWADWLVSYQAGQTSRQVWNRGVFGPTLARWPAAAPEDWATRSGDTLQLYVPLHGDGEGRIGHSQLATGRVELYRNGIKVYAADELNQPAITMVPSGDAGFRLTAEATRGAPFTLSTRTSVAWTFRSGHVSGAVPQRLPLWTVQFAPELDAHNTAGAGRVFSLPVRATAQFGSQPGVQRDLRVEVSYDDGAHWTRVPVVNGRALLWHPHGQGYISLRAGVSDTNGNTVEQTIIRAYRYGTVTR